MADGLDPTSLAFRSLPKTRFRRSTDRKASLTASEEKAAPNITANRSRARGLEILVQCLQHYVDANPTRFTSRVQGSGRGTFRTFVLRRQAGRR